MPYYYDYEEGGRKWVPDEFTSGEEGYASESDAAAYQTAKNLGKPTPDWKAPDEGMGGQNVNDYLGFDPLSVQRWEDTDDGGDGGSRGAQQMSDWDKLTKIPLEYGLQRIGDGYYGQGNVDYFNNTYGTNFKDTLDYMNWLYGTNYSHEDTIKGDGGAEYFAIPNFDPSAPTANYYVNTPLSYDPPTGGFAGFMEKAIPMIAGGLLTMGAAGPLMGALGNTLGGAAAGGLGGMVASGSVDNPLGTPQGVLSGAVMGGIGGYSGKLGTLSDRVMSGDPFNWGGGGVMDGGYGWEDFGSEWTNTDVTSGLGTGDQFAAADLASQYGIDYNIGMSEMDVWNAINNEGGVIDSGISLEDMIKGATDEKSFTEKVKEFLGGKDMSGDLLNLAKSIYGNYNANKEVGEKQDLWSSMGRQAEDPLTRSVYTDMLSNPNFLETNPAFQAMIGPGMQQITRQHVKSGLGNSGNMAIELEKYRASEGAKYYNELMKSLNEQLTSPDAFLQALAVGNADISKSIEQKNTTQGVTANRVVDWALPKLLDWLF